MSPMNLQGFFEEGSELIPAAGGVVRTAAPLIQLSLAWNELSYEETALVSGALYEGEEKLLDCGPATAQQGGLTMMVPLPYPRAAERSLEVRLVSAQGPGVVPVRLKKAWPRIEGLHAANVVCSQAGLYFTLAFRVVADGFSHDRAMVGAMAGFGPDPDFPSYSWRGAPASLSLEGFMQIEARVDQPRSEDFVFLAVAAIDDWGNSDVVKLALPLPQLLTMTAQPSRLEYDHSTQELVNTFPLWAACRARDYLALAHDPAYTMRGSTWKWLGELKDFFVPYDFAFAPVAQRILNAGFGQHAAAIRERLHGLERSRFISTADTGAASHLWRAPLPEATESGASFTVPASPETITSSYWEKTPEATWALAFPDETAPPLDQGMVRAVARDGLRSAILRAKVRVETTLGGRELTSPADSQTQNLAALSGAGAFGLVWRQRRDSAKGQDHYWQLGWGWCGDTFGLWVKRVVNGVETLLYRDAEPRFYNKGEPVTLEVRDLGGSVEVYAGELLVVHLECSDEGEPGHAGLWASPADPGIRWQPFFSAALLEGLPFERLAAVGRVWTEGGLLLKEVQNEEDFFEAAPTHLTLETSPAPVNGLRWGREADPDRLLVEADKRAHRVVWWCEGNQIVKGEDAVGEPLFRYWIWDPGSKVRPLTEYSLLSCVRHRRWLWVLGRHETTGQVRLFVVDPASPAPLYPESCLWCESAFELPVMGVSDLARSTDRLEVYVQ